MNLENSKEKSKDCATLPSRPSPISNDFTRHQEYNAKDCAMTLGVLDALIPQLDNHTAATYIENKALMGPVLEMMTNGVRRDEALTQKRKAEIGRDISILEGQIIKMSSAGGFPGTINPNSGQQLQQFLYGHQGIKPVKERRKDGTFSPSVGRRALEIIRDGEGGAIAIFVTTLFALRDRKMALQKLNMKLDKDGRLRGFIKITGTVTGRMSMTKTVWETGGNLQNLHEEDPEDHEYVNDLGIKDTIIADPGYTLIGADLSQADSWNVGIEVWQSTGDEVFLDAVRSGDIHTRTAKLAWPELPWTGDPKKDRKIAERKFYRHHSYRFMCKKINHGSAYGMRYKTLAKNVRIPEAKALEVSERYQNAFPALFKWQNIKWAELQEHGHLITLLGRKRQFHGRLTDPKTFREAIAFLGQSPTSDIVRRALLSLHKIGFIHLLLQEHDSILAQVKTEKVEEALPFFIRAFSTDLCAQHQSTERVFQIPVDIKTGQNWGAFHADRNPLGLRKISFAKSGAASGLTC